MLYCVMTDLLMRSWTPLNPFRADERHWPVLIVSSISLGQSVGRATIFNDWPASQTGGVRLRLYEQRRGDVTFVEFTESKLQLTAMGFAAAMQITTDVFVRSPCSRSNKYVIIYEGRTETLAFATCVERSRCFTDRQPELLLARRDADRARGVPSAWRGQLNGSAPSIRVDWGTTLEDGWRSTCPSSTPRFDPGHRPSGTSLVIITSPACPREANVGQRRPDLSSLWEQPPRPRLLQRFVYVQGQPTIWCSADAPCSAAYPAGSKMTLCTGQRLPLRGSTAAVAQARYLHDLDRVPPPRSSPCSPRPIPLYPHSRALVVSQRRARLEPARNRSAGSLPQNPSNSV